MRTKKYPIAPSRDPYCSSTRIPPYRKDSGSKADIELGSSAQWKRIKFSENGLAVHKDSLGSEADIKLEPDEKRDRSILSSLDSYCSSKRNLSSVKDFPRDKASIKLRSGTAWQSLAINDHDLEQYDHSSGSKAGVKLEPGTMKQLPIILDNFENEDSSDSSDNEVEYLFATQSQSLLSFPVKHSSLTGASTKDHSKRLKREAGEFPCPSCPRLFDRQCDATKHFKRTHAQGTRKCPHCQRAFHWEKDVKRHLRQVHESTDTDLELTRRLREAPTLNDSAPGEPHGAMTNALPETLSSQHHPGSSMSLSTAINVVMLIRRWKRIAIKLRPSRSSELGSLSLNRSSAFNATNQQPRDDIGGHWDTWAFVTRDGLNFRKVRISSYRETDEILRTILNGADLTMECPSGVYQIQATEVGVQRNTCHVQLRLLPFEGPPSSPVTGEEIREAALQHLKHHQPLQVLLQVQPRAVTEPAAHLDSSNVIVASKQSARSLSLYGKGGPGTVSPTEQCNDLLAGLKTASPSLQKLLKNLWHLDLDFKLFCKLMEAILRKSSRGVLSECMDLQIKCTPSLHGQGSVCEEEVTHETIDSSQTPNDSGSQEQHGHASGASQSDTSKSTSNNNGNSGTSNKRPYEDTDKGSGGGGGDEKRVRRDNATTNEQHEGELSCIFFVGAPNDHPKCSKKYQYMSQLQKHLESTAHHFYACYRCFTRFDNFNEHIRHRRNDKCIKLCNIPGCLRHRSWSDSSSSLDCDCIKSSRQQWLALYHLVFPTHPNPAGYEDVPRKSTPPSVTNTDVPPATSNLDTGPSGFFNDFHQYGQTNDADYQQDSQEGFDAMPSIENPLLDHCNRPPDRDLEMKLAETQSEVEFLKLQIETLEREITRKTASHGQIIAVLGMVWQALVTTSCPASRERSSLWVLVNSHAPDAITAGHEAPAPMLQPHNFLDRPPEANAGAPQPVHQIFNLADNFIDLTWDPSFNEQGSLAFQSGPPLGVSGNVSQPVQSRA